jgi:hypothetical protein
MRLKTAMSFAGGLVLASAASAGIDLGSVFFTYDDPNGPPRELMYTAGNAVSMGHISYSSATPFELVVDASDAGWGVVTYAANITMDVDVGQATQAGAVFMAPVFGTFIVNVGGEDVLTGTINNGAFLTFGTTGNLSANTATVSLTMSVAGGLLAQFDGNQIQPDFNVSWSLSDYLPSAPSLNAFGYLTSFVANTAFVGSAQVQRIPTPGSAALLAVAGLISLPRRRL